MERRQGEMTSYDVATSPCIAQEAATSWKECGFWNQIGIDFIPFLTLHLCDHQDLWWFWDFILFATTNLACYIFSMNAGRRHGNSGSARVVAQYKAFSGVSSFALKVYRGATQKGPGDTSTCCGLCYRRATVILMSLNLLGWAVGLLSTGPEGDTGSSKASLLYKYPEKNSPVQGQSLPLFIGCAETGEVCFIEPPQ